MEEPQCVSVIRVAITHLFGDGGAGHGHIHGAVPKTRQAFNRIIGHGTFNADAVDDIHHAVHPQ